ncbi:MAG: hypothetical protein K0U98_26980 [Deltaproteobacteria bacterium]|nr:hypothetical protein [Deltaproteobacteria bacterium]
MKGPFDRGCEGEFKIKARFDRGWESVLRSQARSRGSGAGETVSSLMAIWALAVAIRVSTGRREKRWLL